jgi:crossover junction endodeoxyribonuclease RuvC
MIVLGIDPGMAQTGFGVVAADAGRLRAVAHGEVGTPAGEAPELRLCALQRRMEELVGEHAPQAAALEDLYVGANPRTILAVGQARGAILAACGAAGVPVAGYAPAEIKSAVCGFGRADKGQVVRMVSAILGLQQVRLSSHAADALAAAVCHAQRSRTRAVRLEAAR